MEEAKQLVVNFATWNAFQYFPHVCASLEGQEWKEFSVTVIDNASNDGIVPWIQTTFPQMTVLRNFRNLGFARAHNQAIALALSRWKTEDWSHRYILMASPGLEFAPDCLRRLVATMEQDPSLAACAPKLFRAVVHRQVLDEPWETERTNILDSTGLIMTKARACFEQGAGEEDRGQYDEIPETFGFSRVCLLVRASVLAEVKLGNEYLDEDMDTDCVDLDLAWRIRRLGYGLRLVSEAQAWHHRREDRKRSTYVRNRIWLIWKNDDFLNCCFHAPWIVLAEFRGAFLACVSLSRIRGAFAALGGVHKMFVKRRSVRQRTGVSLPAMRRWFV